jgi:hypothetical protein
MVLSTPGPVLLPRLKTWTELRRVSLPRERLRTLYRMNADHLKLGLSSYGLIETEVGVQDAVVPTSMRP